jgi:hypothetical protein
MVESGTTRTVLILDSLNRAITPASRIIFQLNEVMHQLQHVITVKITVRK